MTTPLMNRSISTEFYRRSVQFFICLLVLNPIITWADSLVGPEYEVKMGFIFNFANFVTWPDESFGSSDDALYFCFASDHPAANVLFQLNDQPVRSRKLKVQKIDTEIGSEKCHILFFGTDNTLFIRQALAAVRGQHTLTIGEVAGFARMGGIINFFNQDKKLRFEVNLEAAKRENLRLSAQMLQYAQRIVKETEADKKAQQAEIEKLSEKKSSSEEEPQAEEKINELEKTEQTIDIVPPDSKDDREIDEVTIESGTERKVEE